MNLADDDFSLFGLPRRHAQEPSEIDRRWRDLQSQTHPDRFVSEGAAAQRLALQWATRINQARQRLRDPLARGAYLCELAGVAIDAERNTAMPTTFLMQQMQWREALEDARGMAEVQALDDTVAAAEREGLARLAAQLDERADASAAAAEVRALMFVRRFRDDIARRLEALEA